MNLAFEWRTGFLKVFASAAARGLALFFGFFSLVNVVGEWVMPGFDANVWWLDLRSLPATVVEPLLFGAALCLVAFGVQPPRSKWRRALTTAIAACLALFAAGNAVQFYVLFARGAIRPLIPVPLSVLVAAALVHISLQSLRPAVQVLSPRTFGAALAVALSCAFLFPLAQMLWFGKTDYERPADVAVVLGARVYADGRASDALADRVRTGCQLYRQGLAKKVLFSGGPGDGAVHETECMRQMAVRLGVKPEDILTDPAGLNTQATVRNTIPLFGRLHASRILVVSHFYHLPRIKLAYHQAGWEVYTVPARESYLLRQTPYNMAREVAALWLYYFRPLASVAS